MTSFDSSQKHCLAGSTGEETGGLVVKKRGGEFKRPTPGGRQSVLGLDALAREKKREQEEERKRKAEDRRKGSELVSHPKRQRQDSFNSRDGDSKPSVGDVRVSFGSSGHARDRAYRCVHDVYGYYMCVCVCLYCSCRWSIDTCGH